MPCLVTSVISSFVSSNPYHLFTFSLYLVHSLAAGICQNSYKNKMAGKDLTVGPRVAPLWLSQLPGPEEQRDPQNKLPLPL